MTNDGCEQMNLDDYLKKFQNLRTGVNRGHIKPHKPVMLLTILSLIENRKITSNRIDYSPQLLELFKKFFGNTAKLTFFDYLVAI